MLNKYLLYRKEDETMLKKILCTLALICLIFTGNIVMLSTTHAYTLDDYYGTWYLIKTAVESEVTDTIALGDHSMLRIYEKTCPVIHDKYNDTPNDYISHTHPAIEFSDSDGIFREGSLDIDFRKDSQHYEDGYIMLPTYGATTSTLHLSYNGTLELNTTFPQDGGRGWNLRIYQKTDPFAKEPTATTGKKVPKLVREQ